MEGSAKSSRKKISSAKSLQELIHLLMKMNSRLRGKISPPKKRKAQPENLDIVIILLPNQGTNARPEKAGHPAKAKPIKDDWIHDLCEEIEKGGRNQK